MPVEALSAWRVSEIGLMTTLLSLPLLYLLVAYGYLMWWHGRPWLLRTIIHENGRLTLLGSVFYFDHFVACVPMVTLFALCTVGGVAVTARIPVDIDPVRTWLMAVLLLGAAAVLIVVAFVAAVLTVGWQRTLDYALQRIERDGVLSKGGNWNQLQLSNVPIALGTIGSASALRLGASPGAPGGGRLFVGGIACIAAATAILVGLTMLTRCNWRVFRNPRWLAHSMREVATFPLTGIPLALASIVLTAHALSGPSTWIVQPGWLSLLLIGIAASIVAVEFAAVRNADVLALAQKPSFAAEGLSVFYLLAAHVFEHLLDFLLLAFLAAGLYALLCCLAPA